MTIRWTKPANDDFLGIVAWIAANNPAAASRDFRTDLAAASRPVMIFSGLPMN